jgi:phospholipid/cholesterol/gamma-HCH transport system substrate-binding protein
MANANEASKSTKWKVGLFTMLGLGFLGSLTVYINNRPYWWRSCEPIQVTVEDATGLKVKSPVKSLGLEIGYISDFGLVSSGVTLNLCITAPVEIQPDTRAYVRSEGFLGDRFLELKPVRYIGPKSFEKAPSSSGGKSSSVPFFKSVRQMLLPASAEAAEAQAAEGGSARSVPVGEKSTDMEALMGEMKSLTRSLKESINPEEIRGTIRQLNKTLEEASRTFSPQGGLTQTAQRSLIKLEDAIEQMRDQMTRINQGQGSIGMVLNDPVYADELKKAMQSLNKLLGRANEMKLEVNLGIHQMPAYNAGRASVMIAIYPKPSRYYLLGVDMDPRGYFTQSTTTTEVSGVTNVVRTTVQNQGGFNFSLMLGKIFRDRFDVAVGLLRGDGATRVGVGLGPSDNPQQLQLLGDLYFRAKTLNGIWSAEPDARIYAIYQPISIFYITGGVEGFRKANSHFSTFFGGGMRFEDEDIKLLMSFL